MSGAGVVTTASLLREYASALRGSWGGIDGRSEKIALNSLADSIDAAGNTPLPARDVENLRNDLGVCPTGQGHWTEFCDEECGVLV